MMKTDIVIYDHIDNTKIISYIDEKWKREEKYL